MGFIQWIEKWSWILLGYWMGFSALIGVLALVSAVVFMAPELVGSSLLFFAPYLWFRYRDPASTTLPFQRQLARALQ